MTGSEEAWETLGMEHYRWNGTWTRVPFLATSLQGPSGLPTPVSPYLGILGGPEGEKTCKLDTESSQGEKCLC